MFRMLSRRFEVFAQSRKLWIAITITAIPLGNGCNETHTIDSISPAISVAESNIKDGATTRAQLRGLLGQPILGGTHDPVWRYEFVKRDDYEDSTPFCSRSSSILSSQWLTVYFNPKSSTDFDQQKVSNHVP